MTLKVAMGTKMRRRQRETTSPRTRSTATRTTRMNCLTGCVYTACSSTARRPSARTSFLLRANLGGRLERKNGTGQDAEMRSEGFELESVCVALHAGILYRATVF